jgi:glycine cleavage system H protein
MKPEQPQTLFYKRSRFVTRLPVDYLYSPSHYWIARQDERLWRIGLTKFATRMLGEMVDGRFEVECGATVDAGQVLGWLEGFKAIADVFCIAQGVFQGPNPLLEQKITVINLDPYEQGWLYSVEGKPEPKCMDAQAYRALLDKTIDRLLDRQKE